MAPAAASLRRRLQLAVACCLALLAVAVTAATTAGPVPVVLWSNTNR